MKREVVIKNIVIKGAPNDTSALNVDGRHINVDGKHHAFISDSGLANEIEARHSVGKKGEVSKDVVVIKDVPVYAEDGHCYHFGQMPEMPWKRIEREQREKNGEESQI